MTIIESHLVDVTHHKAVHWLNRITYASVVVAFNRINSKVMLIFSSVDIERLLISFVSYAVSYFTSKHHLWAVHEVEHDIFQGWHEGNGVDEIEVDLLVSCYLDSFVAFDEVQEPSQINRMIIDPVPFLRELIHLYLKEQDLAAASCNKCGVVDEVHGSQVTIIDSLVIVLEVIGPLLVNLVLLCSTWNSEALALSVEWVNLVQIWVIKALVWKVLLVTV